MNLSTAIIISKCFCLPFMIYYTLVGFGFISKKIAESEELRLKIKKRDGIFRIIGPIGIILIIISLFL